MGHRLAKYCHYACADPNNLCFKAWIHGKGSESSHALAAEEGPSGGVSGKGVRGNRLAHRAGGAFLTLRKIDARHSSRVERKHTKN